MIIYNVTTKIAAPVADQWLQWILKEHIPAVMNTGCFKEYQVVRLLEVDDSEGPTYAIQYKANDINKYHEYINLFADSLRKESTDRWGNQFIAFRTIMEVV